MGEGLQSLLPQLSAFGPILPGFLSWPKEKVVKSTTRKHACI